MALDVIAGFEWAVSVFDLFGFIVLFGLAVLYLSCVVVGAGASSRPERATSPGGGACYRPVGRPGYVSVSLGWLSPYRRSPGALGGQIAAGCQGCMRARLPQQAPKTMVFGVAVCLLYSNRLQAAMKRSRQA